MARSKNDGGSALERLREFGLRYPGAHTKSPWPGHLDLAVNDKTFAYLSIPGEPLKISCKLPRSSDAALGLPFTTPTAYGLGKSGWVTASFPEGTSVPVDMLEEWIDESYRAQAPKRLSAQVPAHGAHGSSSSGAADAPPRVKKTPARPQLDAPARRAATKKTRAPGSAREKAAGAARSTVKQVASRAGATAASPARSAARRATPRATTPAPRVGTPRGATQGARATAAPTRPGKRARVSPRAAKRTAKKRG